MERRLDVLASWVRSRRVNDVRRPECPSGCAACPAGSSQGVEIYANMTRSCARLNHTIEAVTINRMMGPEPLAESDCVIHLHHRRLTSQVRTARHHEYGCH